MNIRYMFSFLRVMKTPALYPIMKDWQAFVRMHFIFAAYESGLLAALTAPCNREALLGKLKVQRPALLDALLDVGLAAKELEFKNGAFHIRGKRSKAIAGPGGDMLAAMLQASVTYYSDVYRQAAGRLQGSELGDDLDKIGALVARFSKIAEPIIREFIAALVRGKSPMRILDVGCGSAVQLQSAHRANRQVTGIGLDIDEAVAAQARDNLSAWGLKERFDILQEDIRQIPETIAGPFDLITLFNILYYFTGEERPELFKRLRALLAPTGIVAVAMNFDSQGRDIGAANLNMVNTSLKGLTPLPDLDATISLLKRTGFCKIKIHRFIPGSTFYGIVAHNA